MDDSTLQLSHQVFGLTQRTAEGRVRSQAEGIIERLKIYVWPKGIRDEQKLSFLSFFTVHGRSDDQSPSAWATWTLSFICLCFPEMADAITRANSREYIIEALPTQYVQGISHLATAAEDFSDSQPADYTRHIRDLRFPPGLPGVLLDDETFPPDLAACATVPAIYGYCSLLIFLAGKRITEKNVVAITEKRPKNLVDAYKITDEAAFILSGAGRMNSSAHSFVSQVWATYFHARVAVIQEVAAFSTGATLPQRVVYTITKMIEYSGMQPALFIHKFIQARPECAKMTCIRPALNAYITSVREVAAAPAYLQPYYKLIYGDSTRAFHRNAILMLSSCAITHEKYLSASMNNFDLGEGATMAVTMYDAEAASKGFPTLQSLTYRSEKDEEVE